MDRPPRVERPRKITLEELRRQAAAAAAGKSPEQMMAEARAAIASVNARLKEDIAAHTPANWPVDGDYLSQGLRVLIDDDIPCIGVPRMQIVRMLFDARDRSARVNVLLDNSSDIVVDCVDAADSCDHDELRELQPLVQKALAAYSGGHHEAAMALAIVTLEAMAKSYIGDDYHKIQAEVKLTSPEMSLLDLSNRGRYAFLNNFYRHYSRPKGSRPAPPIGTGPVRHYASHDAKDSHFTQENAMLCLLASSSILLGLQEYEARRDVERESEWEE